MGLAKGSLKLLLKEASQRPFSGRVLTLGRQHIYFSYDLLRKIAEDFGVELSDPGEITLHHNQELAAAGYISDDILFRSLGFCESKALDYSDYEFAHYIFDLNSSEVPKHLLEAFDVIIDGGTIEHVFHIPNVLNNIYKMLRQGGRVIHLSPSSNHIDHGFYMFSPTLFWDFYTTNKFEINSSQLFRYTPRRHNVAPWEISDYVPGCLNKVSSGGLDDGAYGICIIATKTKDSTGDIIPQQGSYINIWKTTDRLKNQTETSKSPVSDYSKLQAIKDTVKRFPLLYQILRRLIDFKRSFGKKGLGLKVVARY